MSEHDVEFGVQESEVIQALDLVVPVMYPGERCTVLATPELAYDSLGLPESGIPPSANPLSLTVDLLDVLPAPEIMSLSLEDRFRIGRRKKERGNFWYARKNFTPAINCYRKATDYFDDDRLELSVPIDRFSLPAELQELLAERVKTFNNLAMAQVKIQSLDAALVSLREVLKVEVNE